jgi:hypothetical protein
MDHQWAKRLQEQLRDALYRCYDCWVGLQQQGDAKAGHPGEMDKTKEHLHPGEMDKIKEHLHPGGIDKIKEHLVSFKLILVDKVKPRETMLVLELREEDTLHYATKHLKAIEDLQGQGVSGLEKVLLRQKVVVALIRLLVLPQKLDWTLSTRGIGTDVSIV